MKFCRYLLVLIIGFPVLEALLSGTPLESRPATRTAHVATRREVPPLPIKTYRLANGLRLVVSEDHSTPIAAVAVYYDVGSRNEKPGKSGFAHLFEHMMFQGSENVGKGEHFKYIHEAGGTTNGSTSMDRTNYFEVLPSNQVALGIWLEADRMRSLKVTRENFENQRETVKEERRTRIDNQPHGQGWIRLPALAFQNFAYSHPTIGSMEDLNKAPLSDVQDFFSTYYVPGNAVLVVVGDVDPNQVYKWTKVYFGRIPRKPVPLPVSVEEPIQTKEKREILKDRNAKIPAALIAYHVPKRRHKDYYPLVFLEQILIGGRSSRLYRRLVKDSEVALTVGGGLWSNRGPSLFTFSVRIKSGKMPMDAVALIEAELNQIRQAPPAESEMQKVKNRLRAQFLFSRERVLDRALDIAEFALFDGDSNLINTELNRFLSVTPKQVSEVVRKYFDTKNRTTLELLPEPLAESKKEGDVK